MVVIEIVDEMVTFGRRHPSQKWGTPGLDGLAQAREATRMSWASAYGPKRISAEDIQAYNDLPEDTPIIERINAALRLSLWTA